MAQARRGACAFEDGGNPSSVWAGWRNLEPHRRGATQPRCRRVTQGDRTRTGRTSDLRRHQPDGACPKRSEEHTSELQSHLNLVCRLLLEKKKDLPKPIPESN